MSKAQSKSSADTKASIKDSTQSKAESKEHKGSGHGPLSTKSAPEIPIRQADISLKAVNAIVTFHF